MAYPNNSTARPQPLQPRQRRTAAWMLLVPLLAGCDIPGLGPDPRAVQREAEAEAIGGACRHALRGLEDCYTLNPKAPKAAVFAGWKGMDAYMRENKLEGTPSVLGRADQSRRPERSSDTNDNELRPGGAGAASSRS